MSKNFKGEFNGHWDRYAEQLLLYVLAMAGDSNSEHGTGGMKTKISAAKICTDAGCDMVIANGANPAVLYEITEGKNIGTRFFA